MAWLMTTPATITRRISQRDVTERVARLFQPASPAGSGGPGLVGAEIELIPVFSHTYPPRRVPLETSRALLARSPKLTSSAAITFEPGGQVELSFAPQTSVTALVSQLQGLLGHVQQLGGDAGITFLYSGIDPWNSTKDIGLQLPKPRYHMMQRHFDAIGPAGRRMMRQTGALQVCLDLDADLYSPDRWLVANLAGPALTAAFANSPIAAGTPTGWRSTRSLVWQEVDPSRTGMDGLQVSPQFTAGYTAFALGAEAIPLPRQFDEPLPFRQSFSSWLLAAEARPDSEDLEHHLSTLFPPVRPRGYLEIRYLDALPPRWMDVPIYLLSGLLYDQAACRQALELLQAQPPLSLTSWLTAAQSGVCAPPVRDLAAALFDIGQEGMDRLPAGYLPSSAGNKVANYKTRFVDMSRCPADDQWESFLKDPEDLSPWT